LALVWDVPFVAVNHLEAHLYGAFLEDPALELPLVVMLVSGGHTMLVAMEGHGRYRLLGQTIDDAAGEAFDKVARFLGLDYPGAPAPGGCAWAGGWRPTPGSGYGPWTPASRTACRPSCPTRPCAPTTRPWSPPRAGGACGPTVPAPWARAPTPTCACPCWARGRLPGPRARGYR